MRLGLWLPTFGSDSVGGANHTVGSLASRAEDAGFDSLWVIDHLLPSGAEVHTGAWLDPVVALAAAAAVTERLELGTASLVAGPRHPVMLAKQIASLAVLAGPRLTVGLSSGWMASEYEIFGFELRERGPRTDEVAESLRRLLEGPASSVGPFYPFDEITIAPRPGWRVPIVVAGGGRVPDSGSSNDLPQMADPVLRRICRFDGWLAPCAGDEALTLQELAIVNRAVGDRPFRRLHVQWTHVVDTADRDEALAAQLPLVRRVMGHERPTENLVASYLLGSVDDICARMERIAAAGFDDLIVGPVSNDPEQVDLIAEVARSAGAGGAPAGHVG
ncbi:MAG: LLM class flavin-dependent oxidoreductase [Acidimicrobiales bacterium]